MIYTAQRRELIELCQLLSAKGYFAGTGGNLMQRVDEEHVLVTPSATDYLSMLPEDIAVLRLSNLKQLCGRRKPSVEASLHANVLRLRADVHCSIHTHQPVASAFALLGQPLPVPAEFRASLGDWVPMVGYAPSGTRWLAGKLQRQVSPGINAYLMRNHGVLCVGATSQQALRTLDDLECLAQRQLTELINTHAQQCDGASQRYRRLLNSLQQGAR